MSVCLCKLCWDIDRVAVDPSHKISKLIQAHVSVMVWTHHPQSGCIAQEIILWKRLSWSLLLKCLQLSFCEQCSWNLLMNSARMGLAGSLIFKHDSLNIFLITRYMIWHWVGNASCRLWSQCSASMCQALASSRIQSNCTFCCSCLCTQKATGKLKKMTYSPEKGGAARSAKSMATFSEQRDL